MRKWSIPMSCVTKSNPESTSCLSHDTLRSNIPHKKRPPGVSHIHTHAQLCVIQGQRIFHLNDIQHLASCDRWFKTKCAPYIYIYKYTFFFFRKAYNTKWHARASACCVRTDAVTFFDSSNKHECSPSLLEPEERRAAPFRFYPNWKHSDSKACHRQATPTVYRCMLLTSRLFPPSWEGRLATPSFNSNF